MGLDRANHFPKGPRRTARKCRRWVSILLSPCYILDLLKCLSEMLNSANDRLFFVLFFKYTLELSAFQVIWFFINKMLFRGLELSELIKFPINLSDKSL